MACAEFETLLLEYAELAADARRRADAHVAGCAGCREFLAALAAVDGQLTAQFAGREVSAGFGQSVRRRVRLEEPVRRPSFIPELLDFVGWGAIVALLGLALYWLSPLIPMPGESAKAAISANAAWTVGAAFLLVSFLIGLRSFVDLKH